jgi:hypothetical protein
MAPRRTLSANTLVSARSYALVVRQYPDVILEARRRRPSPPAHARWKVPVRFKTDGAAVALPVGLGRLELEEFAIACLRPSFNRMRRLSRRAVDYRGADPSDWERVQLRAPSLLHAGVHLAIDVDPVSWLAMRPPPGAGLYLLRDHAGQPMYVGESDALAERLGTHAGARSYFSALRRHVGTEVLGLAFAPGQARGFAPADEAAISAYLATYSVVVISLALGRWELERELVGALRPMLNREHAMALTMSPVEAR